MLVMFSAAATARPRLKRMSKDCYVGEDGDTKYTTKTLNIMAT